MLDIKNALMEKEGIDVKQIKLIHLGKQLCVLRRAAPRAAPRRAAALRCAAQPRSAVRSAAPPRSASHLT